MSAAAIPQRASRGQLVQRWIFGAVLATLLGVIAVGLATFAWPTPVARGEIAVAYVSDFAPGTVTSYVVAEDGLRELPSADEVTGLPSGYPIDGRSVFHVVRLPDGMLAVLAGVEPRFNYTVAWKPSTQNFEIESYVGVFVEPRHGSQYTVDGTKLFGPAPRSLDRYHFHIRADGMLVVEWNDGPTAAPAVVEWPPPPYDVTSEGWSTSGWPSE